jgi:serine/threonine protein kinase
MGDGVDLAGTALGDYALGDVLGRGGMSTVYRARDRRSGAEVACKVMNPRVSADPVIRARFARQVCVIDHPNVIPVHELGEASGRLFVVMRLVVGTDVQAALRSGGLPPARAMGIFGQLSGALAALHRRDLLHLDLKPANVLLARDRPDHVFLMDYGLQDAAPDARSDFLGTPNYASPEQLRGTAIGPSSDVYSLTCVLFALLAGRPPFAGRLTEVIGGHLRGRAPSLSALTGLPDRIDRVVAAGLHTDPARRPACPEDLAEAARTALAGC